MLIWQYNQFSHLMPSGQSTILHQWTHFVASSWAIINKYTFIFIFLLQPVEIKHVLQPCCTIKCISNHRPLMLLVVVLFRSLNMLVNLIFTFCVLEFSSLCARSYFFRYFYSGILYSHSDFHVNCKLKSALICFKPVNVSYLKACKWQEQ